MVYLTSEVEKEESKMRYDYKEIEIEKVEVKGIPCEFSDLRIDRATVPKGKFLYEIGDSCSDGVPARIQRGIMVDFYGTLICDRELPLDEQGTLWLEDVDFGYLDT